MRLVFPALIAIFLATPAMAQVSPLQKKDLPELPGKPVSAEIGGEAVVLKGKSLLIAPHQVATVSALKPFLSYELNGKFDYHDQKGRFADLSLRPAVMKSWTMRDPEAFDCPGEPFGGNTIGGSLSFYLDARGRYGSNEATQSAKSYLLGGAGAELRLHVPAILVLSRITGADIEAPAISATYYKKAAGSVPAGSPSLDAVQIAASFEIPLVLTDRLRGPGDYLQRRAAYEHDVLCAANPAAPLPQPPARPKFPFTFSAELKATRPTTGAIRKMEYAADLALKMMQDTSKIGYVLRYQTGKDLGLEYDSKIIAGIVVQLLHPH